MRFARSLALTTLALAASSAALAQEKLTYMSNWYAQAEHGGFYQAQAEGLYRQAGLDVEIIERHHRFKEDAPSGTALAFGRIVAEEMGQTNHVHGRSGRPGQRPHNEIGYHALRTGDNVGEHTIVFGLMGETIDLTVRSHTRDSYAYGALAAAKFVAQQKPGLYGMVDVLKL